MNSTKRGLLIVFEGLDRCGKTTQTKKLKTFFESQSLNSQIINFPGKFDF